MRIKTLKLNKLPFKLRSEFETETLLHRYKVLARKRQIEMYKLDNNIEIQAGNIMQYTSSERRRDLFKVVKFHLQSLLP